MNSFRIPTWQSWVVVVARWVWWRGLLALLYFSVAPCCRSQPSASLKTLSSEQVGRAGANRIVTPVNQILTPAGLQVDLPGLRPQVIALSPDGRLLAVSGKTHELVMLDAATGSILQRVPLPSDTASDSSSGAVSNHILEPDKEGQASFSGLVFSPDGSKIFLSNVNGNIKVFGVAKSGQVIGLSSLPLPPADAPGRKEEIPSGLALSA